jgi:hypothetical protein
MGLDMYLTKKIWIKNYLGTKEEDLIKVTITKNGEPMKGINSDKIQEVIEEVAYWRKFNALHIWFVNNIQNSVDDCGEYHLSKQNVIKLLSTLKQVDTDNSKAEELLPAVGGFFFGGTHYDGWYFENVKRSIEIFEEVLQNIEIPNSYYYYSSSW